MKYLQGLRTVMLYKILNIPLLDSTGCIAKCVMGVDSIESWEVAVSSLYCLLCIIITLGPSRAHGKLLSEDYK